MKNESSLSPFIIKYEEALVRDPRSRAFAPLAECYRKLGLFDKALEVLQRGIRYNPEYLLGYLGLAQCYFDMKQFQMAYSTLRPLVNGNRENIKLQKLFADVCYDLNHYEEALDTYKFLLFLNPKYQEAAERVEELEGVVKETVREIPEDLKIFTEEKIEPSPTDESLDDWVKVDFAGEGSSESDEWSMGNLAEIQDEVNTRSEGQPDEASLENLPKDINEKSDASDFLKKNARPVYVDDFLEEESVKEGVEEKEEAEEKPKEKEVPLMTMTLVDLYLEQGHHEKALEILNKIKEIQPQDEATLKKLEHVRGLISDENSIEDLTQDEGHSKLMKIIDRELPESESPAQEVHAEPAPQVRPEKSGQPDEMVDALSRFLDQIKKKASEKSSTI